MSLARFKPSFNVSGNALFEPSYDAAVGGSLTINADFLAGSSDVFEPTLTAEQTLTADFLAGSSVVYDPVVTAEQTLTADFLTGASLVYAPTITTGSTIHADFVAGASLVYAPTLTTEATITADFLSGNSLVFEPTLFSGETLVPDFLAGSSVVYEPVLTTEVTLTADFLTGYSVVYEPEIQLQLQTITADFVDGSSTAYQPTITGGAVVSEETYAGGWYQDWIPTKEQIRKQREALGIIKPEIDQITRVIKKVSKKQIEPEQARKEAQTYFAKQDLQFAPKHEQAIDALVSFLQENQRYNPVEYAANKAQIDAQRAREAQEHNELIGLLKAQQAAQEEMDMVFIITCLAA